MQLPTLDISYKWNHIWCGLLCLASFTQHNIFKVHPCWSMNHYLTLLYGWIIFHCMDCTHSAYPFISWWTFGLFLLFWLLWIMLLITFMYKFLCQHMFSLVLGIYLGVELLGHTVMLSLTVWGTANRPSLELSSFDLSGFLPPHQALITVPLNLCYIFQAPGDL